MTNFKTEYISRNDFVSDEAWEKFLRFNVSKSKNQHVTRCKRFRQKKKMLTFKEVIKCLKTKEESNAAEYLKVY